WGEVYRDLTNADAARIVETPEDVPGALTPFVLDPNHAAAAGERARRAAAAADVGRDPPWRALTPLLPPAGRRGSRPRPADGPRPTGRPGRAGDLGRQSDGRRLGQDAGHPRGPAPAARSGDRRPWSVARLWGPAERARSGRPRRPHRGRGRGRAADDGPRRPDVDFARPARRGPDGRHRGRRGSGDGRRAPEPNPG